MKCCKGAGEAPFFWVSGRQDKYTDPLVIIDVALSMKLRIKCFRVGSSPAEPTIPF